MHKLFEVFVFAVLSVMVLASPGFAQQPDPSKWYSMNKFGDTTNSELQCYQPAQDVVTGGFLTITTAFTNVTCGPSNQSSSYNSGMVTWNAYNFTYGTLEFRAKMAGGQGTWPSIWLLGYQCEPSNANWSASQGTCNWPAPGSDEIDVTEILNSNHTAVSQQIHSNGHNDGCTATTKDVTQNYHTYDLVWTPGSLIWKIDGTTTCTITQSYVPNSAMFLIIDTAVGGAGGSVVNTSLPQTMSVDYVRQWNQAGVLLFDDEFSSSGTPGPLAFATTSLPGGTVGTAYSATVSVTGGVAPYLITGAGLPPGLTVSATGVISGTPSTSGNYTATFNASDSASPPNTATIQLAISIGAHPPPPTIRVRAGGGAYTDSTGAVWSADTGFTQTSGSTYCTGHAITGTTSQPLYQCERWGIFSYAFAATNGTYSVTLKFSENSFAAAGKRIFNVSINGAAVLTNFDIFAAAGGEYKGVDETFPITVTNGTVSITFTRGSANVDYPKVDAIAIVPSGPPVIGVSISPTTANVVEGATRQFTATVVNDPANAGVNWTSTGGMISSTGLFTAPATTGGYTVTATSVSDPTKTASATVTITPPPPALALSCSGLVCTITPANIPSGTAYSITVTSDGASATATGTTP